jgi:hypothetical protein
MKNKRETSIIRSINYIPNVNYTNTTGYYGESTIVRGKQRERKTRKGKHNILQVISCVLNYYYNTNLH